jgi:phenylacetate-coenzyme A ligase PaaK-like adenylate-forming protein
MYVRARRVLSAEGGKRRSRSDTRPRQDLPFTDKEEIKNSQLAQPPFSDYVACDVTDIVRHRTSGTTGRGMNLAYTRYDADLAARLGGRACMRQDCDPATAWCIA